MQTNYLIQLIRTLSLEEQKQLVLYIESPFFNRSKFKGNMKKLFMLMVDEVQPLDKKALFSKLFPKEIESVSKLDKNMTELGKLIRSFLMTNYYWRSDNAFHQNLDWAGLLRQRAMETRYLRALSQLKELQAAVEYESTEYYLNEILYEQEVLVWENYNNRVRGGLNLPALFHKLEIYYQLNRLEWLNRLLLQQKVVQVNLPKQLDFLSREIFISESLLEQSASLRINYQIYQALKSEVPDVKDFYALTDLLKQHEKKIEPDAMQEFYTFLRNTCTLLINFGHSEMLAVLFTLQKDNLEKGYFYHKGKISHSAFGNIVTVATKVGAQEWALGFMEEHKTRIIGNEETNDFYKLTMASYFFSVKDFESALDWIPGAPQDTLYLFRARRLKLKAQFELDSELLPYEMDAFKMMLSRAAQKLISPQFRELQANFINFLYQVVHTATSDKPRLRRLAQRISDKSPVSEKDWLLEKINQMLLLG